MFTGFRRPIIVFTKSDTVQNSPWSEVGNATPLRSSHPALFSSHLRQISEDSSCSCSSTSQKSFYGDSIEDPVPAEIKNHTKELSDDHVELGSELKDYVGKKLVSQEDELKDNIDKEKVSEESVESPSLMECESIRIESAQDVVDKKSRSLPGTDRNDNHPPSPAADPDDSCANEKSSSPDFRESSKPGKESAISSLDLQNIVGQTGEKEMLNHGSRIAVISASIENEELDSYSKDGEDKDIAMS